MRNFVCLVLLGLVISACAVGTKTREQVVFDSWATACEGYANTLITFAPGVANGSVSDETIAVLDEAKEFIGPFCRDGVPTVDGDKRVTQQIQELLLRLNGLEVPPSG